MTTTSGELRGSCLCGAVQFRVLPPTLRCTHCHCTICQRTHGAAFVTWVGTAEMGVTIDAAHLHWDRSSAEAERGFCAICGSTLFFRSRRWPGELHIVRAHFSGGIDREPQAHAYYDSRVGWCVIADGLPQVNA